MKLIFVIKKLSDSAGGAERVLCSICNELSARGHSITLISFDEAESRPFYVLNNSVKHIKLPIGDSSKPATFYEVLLRSFALRKVVIALNPDAVIGFMHSAFVPLAFTLVGLRIPIFASEHIVPAHYKGRRFQWLLFKMAVPFIKKITVLSDSIKATYPPSIQKKMVSLPNPVTPVISSIKRSYSDDVRTIVTVGRLDTQKDHETLIKAFKTLSYDFPELRLRIVGEGPLRSSLEHLIVSLGLELRVLLVDKTKSIHAVYDGAQIFVIPSRYESFGLVTAEAMSTGLPVVGFSDCPGTNELIDHEDTGLLANPDGLSRAEVLAENIKRLILDSNLRKKLGESARIKINSSYSLSKIADEWESFLGV